MLFPFQAAGRPLINGLHIRSRKLGERSEMRYNLLIAKGAMV